MTLQVNSSPSPIKPPAGTNDIKDTIDEMERKPPAKERASVKKKKKKKKKKFVVRAKVDSPAESGPPIPFYLAQTTSALMTPKQQRQMEDLLLGGGDTNTNGAEPKDIVNPLHSSGEGQGRKSVEKRRQRAEEKCRREAAAAAVVVSEGGEEDKDDKAKEVEVEVGGEGKQDEDSGVVERTSVQMLGGPVSLLSPAEQKDEEGPMTVEEIEGEGRGEVENIEEEGQNCAVANMTLSPMHLTPPPGLPPLKQMQKKANTLPPLARRSSSVGSVGSIESIRSSPSAWAGRSVEGGGVEGE